MHALIFQKNLQLKLYHELKLILKFLHLLVHFLIKILLLVDLIVYLNLFLFVLFLLNIILNNEILQIFSLFVIFYHYQEGQYKILDDNFLVYNETVIKEIFDTEEFVYDEIPLTKLDYDNSKFIIN